ncbi:hypothetical protein FKP32DRAFT_127748 [Trametes sanguinea]|nr:hypothetical protein FKP32DRAFT_127748 [Trametes sanguinea]
MSRARANRSLEECVERGFVCTEQGTKRDAGRERRRRRRKLLRAEEEAWSDLTVAGADRARAGHGPISFVTAFSFGLQSPSPSLLRRLGA